MQKRLEPARNLERDRRANEEDIHEGPRKPVQPQMDIAWQS
jgi:hypothetical protein